MATEEFVTPGGPNVSKNGTIDDEYYIPQLEAARLLVLITFPVIFIIGTIGNVLTFIVMQRGSLKHSSTCFYMAMLAVADTSKSIRLLLRSKVSDRKKWRIQNRR